MTNNQFKKAKLRRVKRLAAAGMMSLVVSGTADARRTTESDPTPEVVTNPNTPMSGPKMFRLESATIQDIQAAMDDGSLTSTELVSLYLRRIQAYDVSSTVSPSQPLNSVAALNPNLLEDAAEADRLRKAGTVTGPLHGIPFLVKWSYPIKGMAITGGTTGWKDLVTQNECWSVAKMREAGGIAMGHANMDTWAASASTSTSQIKGTVRSSYLQGAAPGGSSGGSGVSSGAYLTTFAFGGETGGSIRHPSDRNDLVGYKVSGGSISVNKIIPLAPDRDVIGPMTRNTADNAIVRDIVGKEDPDDLWTPVHGILAKKRPLPQTGFVNAIQGATLKGKKIGIIGTYVGMTHPNPESDATAETKNTQTINATTLTAVLKMKQDMEAAGATVEYVFMPREVSTTYPLPAGSPSLLLDRTAPLYNNTVAYGNRGVIEAVVKQPGETYSQTAAKVLQTATLVNSFISSTIRGLMYNYNAASGIYTPGAAIGFDGPEAVQHFSARSMHHDAFEAWMDAQGLDAVVWPVFANKTRTGGTTIGRDLANIMNLPCVTVPMGKITDVATSSLPEGQEPITLNICGRYNDDQKVLGIAYAYEQATKLRYSPPLAPPISGEQFDAKRQSKKGVSSDKSAPVLTVAPSATRGASSSIIFTGSVVDAGSVDRLEVSIAGALIPATVEGMTWRAVLPSANAANAFITNTSAVNIVVLAVDAAGNATCQNLNVTL